MKNADEAHNAADKALFDMQIKAFEDIIEKGIQEGYHSTSVYFSDEVVPAVVGRVKGFGYKVRVRRLNDEMYLDDENFGKFEYTVNW